MIYGSNSASRHSLGARCPHLEYVRDEDSERFPREILNKSMPMSSWKPKGKRSASEGISSILLSILNVHLNKTVF